MRETCLITGANGYLGGRLADRMLKETGTHLALWLHAESEEAFHAKKQPLLERWADFNDRLNFFWGQFEQDAPFAGLSTDGVSAILHSAADTRFNVDRSTAETVNIMGTEKLLQFAAQCPNLKQFGLLSTVYASGLQTGELRESPWRDTAGFSNFYEWSKWSAEDLLISRYPHLPWQIYRVATIIADDDSGLVTQQNAFHNTLKLLYYGLLSLIPGKNQTPLYFVTGEFVTQALFHLIQAPISGQIHHLCHSSGETLTLGQLIDLAYEVFEQDPDFKARRILKPLFCDEESFQLMSGAVHSFGGSIVNQALSSVTPFAKQLFLEKSFDNQNLRAHYLGYAAPNPEQLIRNTCQSLVQTKWGRHAPAIPS